MPPLSEHRATPVIALSAGPYGPLACTEKKSKEMAHRPPTGPRAHRGPCGASSLKTPSIVWGPSPYDSLYRGVAWYNLGSNTTRMVNGFPSGQLYFDFDTTHLPPRIASKSDRNYCVVRKVVTMIPSRMDNP